jgi:tyrosinase
MAIRVSDGLREQQGRPRVRKNVRKLPPKELNALRNAFEDLYAINNPNDDRGYSWIAGLHGYPGNYCHKGEDDFWTWHRAYMYEFEERLRDTQARRGQQVTMTLPWWDWTLRDPETDDEFGIPRAFSDATYIDLETKEKKPNPLFSAASPATGAPTARNPGRFREMIPSFAQNVKKTLETPIFVDAQGILNFGAHGTVHLRVGGGRDMGNARTAAYDPIFWFHHAFIDKIFWEWQRLHGNDTVSGDRRKYIAQPFKHTGDQLLDAEGKFGYTYRDMEVSAAPEGRPFAVVGGEDRGAVIHAQLEIGARRDGVTGGTLQFLGMARTRHSYELRVFFDAKNPTVKTRTHGNKAYAGTLALFGHGDCVGGKGHCKPPTWPRRAFDRRPEHHYSPFTAILDVSDALARVLKSPKRAAADTLDVTILVVDSDGKASASKDVAFDSLSLEIF